MKNHSRDKCYKLQRDIKNIERAKNDNKMNKFDQRDGDEEDTLCSKN